MLPSFGRAAAEAALRGERDGRCIRGTLRFYPDDEGTLVVADLRGLPDGGGESVYALHIHEGACCEDPACSLRSDPNPCSHPYCAGALPPVFSHRGRAVMAVYTGRFRVSDIVGKTVVLSAGRGNDQSRLAGSDGDMIACGEILRNCWR